MAQQYARVDKQGTRRWKGACGYEQQMAAIRNGKLLKSSLEIYAPLNELTKAAPVNRAQSLKSIKFTNYKE